MTELSDYKRLVEEPRIENLRGIIQYWKDICAARNAEIERLRAAFLTKLMRENECYCFQHGVPCNAAKCGCLVEMQAYIDEQKGNE